MSAAIKLATLASGITLFSASALYSMTRRQQDFSKSCFFFLLSLDMFSTPIAKPKLYVEPSSFFRRSVYR